MVAVADNEEESKSNAPDAPEFKVEKLSKGSGRFIKSGDVI